MGCACRLSSPQVTYGVLVDHDGIDPESPVPPYRQVAAILRARIESGELPPGRRLPSIATLTQTYGIARTTAAKALGVLVDEGLAMVSPGMGTYVAKRD